MGITLHIYQLLPPLYLNMIFTTLSTANIIKLSIIHCIIQAIPLIILPSIQPPSLNTIILHSWVQRMHRSLPSPCTVPSLPSLLYLATRATLDIPPP